MGKTLTIGLCSFLVLTPGLWASKQAKTADKLDKELTKVTFLASDLDGRRVVNRVMAKQLAVSRKQLVEERRQTGLVYGQIFAAHEVAQLAGLAFDKVAERIQEGQTLLEVCDQNQVNMKRILKDAKKLNKAIDAELDRLASGEEESTSEEAAESYDPAYDSLPVDTAGFATADLLRARDLVHRRAQPAEASGPLGQEAGRELGAGRGAAGRPSGGGGRGPGPR